MHCPFQEKVALTDIFAQVKDVDEQVFGVILAIFRKEKVQDCIGYFSDNGNQGHFKQQILQGVNLKQVENEQKLSDFRNNTIQITDVLKKLKDHDFNSKDYSSEEYQDSKLSLIKNIKDNIQITEFLKFLVHLTSIDKTLIQCGSNSLNILVQMKLDLRNKNFENIKIQNTSLVGANFAQCNLSGSEFNNVNIVGVNLNGAILFNCKWINLIINKQNKLDGHTKSINSVCLSPDGITLASGSNDKSIRLWDVKTG
ncbi:unnamed protein product [Paramecium primaurelia]|uniref:Uncharacterized protein n=1 Tax=Paramecium primaurelia TaxID=5886 RepID=A0A8S1PIK6_PARPR|nr:unnamed protein product [Paramecium primaurelia]